MNNKRAATFINEIQREILLLSFLYSLRSFTVLITDIIAKIDDKNNNRYKGVAITQPITLLEIFVATKNRHTVPIRTPILVIGSRRFCVELVLSFFIGKVSILVARVAVGLLYVFNSHRLSLH